MPILGGYSTPGTAIVTTAETLAQNIPPTAVAEPAAAAGALAIRGNVQIATGTTVTEIFVRLRVGQNNVSTALVDTAEPVAAGASGNFAAPFEFIDPNGVVNLSQGYSITVVQTGAGTNGSVTAVDYEVDVVVP